MTGEPAEPFALDLVRMRAERVAKLRAEMAEKGVDAVVALTSGGVLYATGRPHAGGRHGSDLRPAGRGRGPGRRPVAPPLHPVPAERTRRAARRPPAPGLPARDGRRRPGDGHHRRRPAGRGPGPGGRRRLHDADVGGLPRGAGGGRAGRRRAAVHRRPPAQDTRRGRVPAPLLAHERGGDPGGRGAGPARRADLGAERGLPVRAVPARGHHQLPRPGVPAHARAGGRRALEHQRRHPLQPGDDRPRPVRG